MKNNTQIYSFILILESLFTVLRKECIAGLKCLGQKVVAYLTEGMNADFSL